MQPQRLSARYEVMISVQPEFKVPSKDKTGDLRWTSQDLVYPFWGMKRQDTPETEWNCEVVRQSVQVLVSVVPSKGVRQHSVVTDGMLDVSTYSVTVPVIINTKPVAADKELVLRHQVLPKKTPPSLSQKYRTNTPLLSGMSQFGRGKTSDAWRSPPLGAWTLLEAPC